MSNHGSYGLENRSDFLSVKSVLPGSVQDEVCDAVQDVRGAIELLEGVAGGAMGVDGCGACFFHAV